MSTKKKSSTTQSMQSNPQNAEIHVMSTIGTDSTIINGSSSSTSPSHDVTATAGPALAPVPTPAPAPPSAAVGPPPGVVIPDPPAGFTVIKGGFGRGVRPRKAELITVADAAAELHTFQDWQVTLGKAAPDPTAMANGLSSAGEWSVMRGDTKDWYLYCSNEEGIAWVGVRAQMAIVKPLLQAAVTADPSIATKYPKLCALFGARSSIAQKGATARKANQKAEASGQPATHGTAGKKRQRDAEKAALAEKLAAATANKPAAATSGNATNAAGNGGSNGASHA